MNQMDSKGFESHNRDLLIAFLAHLFEAVSTQTMRVTIKAGSSQQLVAICLHGTILELSRACITLTRSGDFIGVSPLVRSIVEAFVDLRVVAKDAGHVKRMEATYYKELVRILGQFKDNYYDGTDIGNDFGADEANEVLARAKKRFDQLTRGGAKTLSSKDRFSQGNLRGYRAVYWLLCLDSHNNLRALEKRHIRHEGGQVGISVFKRERSNFHFGYCQTVADMLVGSLKEVAALVGMTGDIPFDRLERLRVAVIDIVDQIGQRKESGTAEKSAGGAS